MIITMIRWRDACYLDAANGSPAKAELSELCEVGFLLHETDDAVLIGMETQMDDTHPGRWRVNIPKASIIERRDADCDSAFPVPAVTRRKKKK